MSKQLFSAMLSREQDDGFGGFRSFQIGPNSIEETEKTYTRFDNTGVYQNCPVYKTTKPIKLSTPWNGEGRPFLTGPKKMELPTGSYIYLIPDCHQIYSLDSWTHFNVVVRE